MRKVQKGSKGKGIFAENPMDLSNMLAPSPISNSLMEASSPPGAGAAASVSEAFEDDFSSMFPSAVTLEPSILSEYSGT
jgi:hypothetical protein